MESSRAADIKPRILDTNDKMKSWKFPDITDASQLRTLKLPDSLTPSKVFIYIRLFAPKLHRSLVLNLSIQFAGDLLVCHYSALFGIFGQSL